eukprot:sb/3476174/
MFIEVQVYMYIHQNAEFLRQPTRNQIKFSSSSCRLFMYHLYIVVTVDPDLPGPDIPEPRFTGTVNFPRYWKLTVFDPDIPGTPIYRAKSFPPRIPVNRGPTVLLFFLFIVHAISAPHGF